MAIVALIAYVILRNNSYPDWVLELFLFNSVALLSIFSLKLSPIPDDQVARIGVATAIGFWSIGSLASSLDTFLEFPWNSISISYQKFATYFSTQQHYLDLRGQYEIE